MDECNERFLKRHWTAIAYCFFGLLTGLVNYTVYLPLYNLTDIPATLINVVAWAAAVTFAYLTNKSFVFKNRDWSPQVLVAELSSFFGYRAITGTVETLLIFILVDMIELDGNLWKLIISLIMVIFNYFTSKLVFKKK